MLRKILIGLLMLTSAWAHGQFSDNFTDGDFVRNPRWSGEVSKFEIASEVLHLNDATASGAAYLSTSSEAVTDAVWECTVEISENPSASNFTRIYLMADRAELSGELNGYFVRVGGSEDEVSLYRQDGSSTAKVIDGTNNRVDTKPVQVRIRVTRDAQGNWQLLSQTNSESAFYSEGSVRDETYTTSRYFGVYCQYTSTRKDAFYFDDFLVSGSPYSGPNPPELADPAYWQDVIINEWMPDPNPVVTDLPDAEFIELYNATRQAFSLHNWSLNGKLLPRFELPAGQYVILAPAAVASEFEGYGEVLSLASWPMLSNSGRTLVLQDPEGRTIDSLTYSGSEVVGGYTRERIRTSQPCDRRSNYGTSVNPDGGTPARQNSLFDDQPDTQVPRLERAVATGPQEVRLSFDEAVSMTDIRVGLTPLIDQASVRLDSTDQRTIVVKLAEALSSGVNYRVTVDQARDCFGNEANGLITEFRYDNVPPAIAHVVLRDTAALVLVFSEPLTSFGSEADYTIDNGIGPARSVQWAEDSASVQLVFSASLDNRQVNWLTVANATDRFGNVAALLTYGFRFQNDIDTVRVVSAYQVNVVLAKTPTKLSAQQTDNYRIDRKLGHPNVVVTLSPNEMQLIYGRPLSANKFHELQIANLTDTRGAPIHTPTYRFAYDQRAPSPDSVTVVDERTLLVYFDEKLAEDDQRLAAAFTINQSIGSPERVILQADQQSLKLHLSQNLRQETVYELSMIGLADRSGNTIANTKKVKFSYDRQPPKLQRWQLVSPKQLRLDFHEALDTARATDPSAYRIDANVRPGGIVVSTLHPGRIDLYFDHMLPKMDFQLYVNQLADLQGNALNEPWVVTVENRLPSLGEALLRSATELQLHFTHTLDKDVMQTKENYQLNYSTYPTQVAVTDHTVALRWSETLVANEERTLIINRIVNQNQQEVEDTTVSFIYDTKVANVTLDDASVLIDFTVPLDPQEAIDVSHYSVADAGNPVAVLLTGPRSVRLVFAQVFAPATVHTLNLSGLLDQDRGTIPASQHPFGQGQSPKYHQLLITEIMADPSPTVGLPEAEYVELFNASDQLLSTTGLRFADARTSTILPNALLRPGEYVIVSDDTDRSVLSGQGQVITVGSLPSLNSTGDSLSLTDSYGRAIFSVAYADDWYNDAEKKAGGWSLEMVDPQRPCGEQDNWTASVDPLGGTPGRVNSVDQANPDHFGPRVVRAVAQNDTTVRITFDERLGTTSVYSAQVQFNPALATRVVDWQPAQKQVVVTLGQPLQTQQRYSVQISNVSDCSGNLMAEADGEVTFVLPEAADTGDILLSELLFYPRSGGEKFVELYNRSGKSIDLRGWYLANVQGDSVINPKVISESHYVLAPGAYVALTEGPTVVKMDYPAAPESQLLRVNALPSLPADAGTVALLNPARKTMEQFGYAERNHHPILNDTRGISLERIAWDYSAREPATWQSAAKLVGYATPGYRNSQLIDPAGTTATISVDPPVFAPGHAGHADYTQIHYQFAQAGTVANVIIYDTQGRAVRQLAQNATLAESGFLTWDGTTDDRQRVGIGHYLIFFEAFDTRGHVNVFKEKVVVGGFW